MFVLDNLEARERRLAAYVFEPWFTAGWRPLCHREKVAEGGHVIQDGDVDEGEQPPAPLAKALQCYCVGLLRR